MKVWGKRKVIRTIWFSLVSVFMIWNWLTYQSRDLPANTFVATNLISIEQTNDRITFHAGGKKRNLELIFFQGGLTDPKAYAPLCRQLAESGFTSHIIRAAWRLPQYDNRKVTGMFDLTSGRYVVGGHSQGGKTAAQLVFENPGVFHGLFLLGTSHPRDISLSDRDIPCLKLYGGKDGLASTREVLDNQSKLPKETKLILIEGANHSQFGYLGKLLLDDAPDISLQEQQRQTVDYLIDFLIQIEKDSVFSESEITHTMREMGHGSY